MAEGAAQEKGSEALKDQVHPERKRPHAGKLEGLAGTLTDLEPQSPTISWSQP